MELLRTSLSSQHFLRRKENIRETHSMKKSSFKHKESVPSHLRNDEGMCSLLDTKFTFLFDSFQHGGSSGRNQTPHKGGSRDNVPGQIYGKTAVLGLGLFAVAHPYR